MKTRILSMLLVLAMVVSMIPWSASAADARQFMYVDAAASEGGDGSEESPFRSFAEVIAFLQSAPENNNPTTVYLLSDIEEDIHIPMGSNIIIASGINGKEPSTINGSISLGLSDEGTPVVGPQVNPKRITLLLDSVNLNGADSSEYGIFSENTGKNGQYENLGEVDLTANNVKIENYRKNAVYLTNALRTKFSGCGFYKNASDCEDGKGYVVDLNLIGVQKATVSIENSRFENNKGQDGVIHVAERGGPSDKNQPWGENAGTDLSAIPEEFLDVTAVFFGGLYFYNNDTETASAKYPFAEVVIGSDSELSDTVNTTGSFSLNCRGASTVPGKSVRFRADYKDPTKICGEITDWLTDYFRQDDKGGIVIGTDSIHESDLLPANIVDQNGEETVYSENTVDFVNKTETGNFRIVSAWNEISDYAGYDENHGMTCWNVISVSTKDLKQHTNAQGETGFWTGFALRAPEYSTKFKYSMGNTVEELEKCSGLMDIEQAIDGKDAAGVAFYADPFNDPVKYCAVQFFGGVQGDIPLTWVMVFRIDWTGVEKYSPAVTPEIRGVGPAVGIEGDFDYQAAYKAAGVTWKSEANKITYTVDEKAMKEFVADEANADQVTALTNGDHLYLGVVFPTPSSPSNITKLSYTVNDGEAVEVDLSGEDGPNLFKPNFIEYFGLAGKDGTMLTDSTWTIAIDWKDSGNTVVAESSVVVERVIEEEQATIPGGGGGSVTPDPEPTPEPDDSTVTTTTEVKPEINGSTAQATVDSTSMNQTVEDAINAAAEQQKAPEVEVKVPVTDGVDSVEVTLPQDSVAALGKAEGSVLTISSDAGTVSLDNTAVASVAQQAEEQITVSIKPVDASDLNKKQQATVGDAPVYEIAIKSGNTVISSLGGGKATVKVPYTLKAGENSNGIVAYFLDDMGNIHICSSKYDAENEMVIFTTTHFSKYMVKYVAEMDWDNTFTDVDNGQWYYPAVGFVVENGLMNGYGDDTFGPSNKLKRSEFAQILYNAEGKPDISNEDLGYPFEDVAGDVWYADAVYWARLNGIVEGVTDTAFGPDKYITREQLAVMLYRYAEFKEYDLTKGDATLNDFTDKAAISAYAKTAMEWAVSVGVVNGKENKILDPKGTAKRAEVAQMLQNFYGVFEK
jgi:hypothetical protein